ncbi:hypothetical protein F8S13_10340 [Chloroflexia bacterium SDU3-3]|nr:hypothetical protein F8S13_10340 [Chloroflexia bacterium SDU3-3]
MHSFSISRCIISFREVLTTNSCYFLPLFVYFFKKKINMVCSLCRPEYFSGRLSLGFCKIYLNGFGHRPRAILWHVVCLTIGQRYRRPWPPLGPAAWLAMARSCALGSAAPRRRKQAQPEAHTIAIRLAFEYDMREKSQVLRLYHLWVYCRMNLRQGDRKAQEESEVCRRRAALTR